MTEGANNSQPEGQLTWIATNAAARLVIGPRGKTHPSTIVRWILSGRIRGRRQGRWWQACKEDVEALARAYDPADAPRLPPKPKLPSDREREAEHGRAMEYLRRKKIIR